MYISYNEACALNCSTLALDLELCEKQGFDFIEIRFDMLMQYLQTHTIDELADFFANHHIKPHAFNAFYLYPEFLTENDDSKRSTFLMGQFLFACEIAKKIDCHYMIVVPPFLDTANYVPFPGTEDEKAENCIRMLKHLAPIAQRYDMNLCFELVGFPRSSVRDIPSAKRIVEAVNMDNVGYVFDVYNIFLNSGENDYQAMETVEKDKIFAIHLNNADEVPAMERAQDKRNFLDQGILDLNGFFGVLKSIGYQGMCSIETFRPSHWAQTPEWVIETAYQTTYQVMHDNDCI